MKIGLSLLALVAVCCAEKWQWPEGASSVRIDTKVRFIDNDKEKRVRDREPADEVPFREAVETEGFYNRPSGSGRYHVRVENAPYRVDHHSIYAVQPHHSGNNYNTDGTLDSLQYCKCVSTPDCNPRQDSARACGSGQFLCCYKRPNKGNSHTEFFNEIDDERPMLLPGRESIGRPFPPPNSELEGLFGTGQGHEAVLGAVDRGVIIGPQRPTGHLGNGNPGVLVGPGGPSGHVGRIDNVNPGVLVGPNGPSGHIGPVNQNPVDPNRTGKQNTGVLVGPDGPTGIIGPANANKAYLIDSDRPLDPIHPEESAQRGVLVGPGGPTGLIGPQGGYGMRTLVGPGGPTGFIGPRRPGFGGYFNNRYGRPTGRGVLVGPGGPTGTIGPGRGLLVGPGGPTGMIGPQGYFGK